jgi:type II secretory pathway component PulF
MSLTRDDAAELTGGLAGLTATGLPLPDGLRALGAELERPRLRRAFLELAQAIERGEPLDQALARIGGNLPPDLAGLATAAVRSGQVTQVLGESARLQRLRSQLRRWIWIGLAYPALLLSFFTGLVVLISTLVIRQFEEIFSDFGIALPWVTMVIIRLARFFSESGWILVTGPLVVWLFIAFFGIAIGSRARIRVVRSIPLLGPAWLSTTMAEFCHLLAILVESCVPLPEALTLAGSATRDEELVDSCNRAAGAIEAGSSLADAMDQDGDFVPGFSRLLRWAEQSRSLPEALHVAGELFEARARPQAAFLTTFVTIAVVFLVLFGTGFTLIALFLPLIKLLVELSG